MSDEQQGKAPAKCRGCGMELEGTDYCYGGSAYHPCTGDECKVNFYGGYVCSPECDYRSSLELEGSMPGCRNVTRLSSPAEEDIRNNWGEGY